MVIDFTDSQHFPLRSVTLYDFVLQLKNSWESMTGKNCWEASSEVGLRVDLLVIKVG